jgi:hypothetical protein
MSRGTQKLQRMLLTLLVILPLFGATALASVTASISGTVKDPSGATVVGATVIATSAETGIAQTLHTNEQGYYSFQSLPLGHYSIDVQQSGFKSFRETGLVLDVNSALVVDVTLQVGEVKESMTISSAAVHVETATTQMGEVISGHEMTEVPLATRSYTDLLALQPGVVASPSQLTGAFAGSFQSAGFALAPVSGSLNTGGLSVNGMREAANSFMLNGATVQETGFGGTAVIPNLDSIAEFRILTNNFDVEYGNSSGGQINVITKSGGNEFHGDMFEFLRNTNLDARNFFDTARGAYHQNQFGGTIGGPIRRERIFFFADYQGNRIVQGISTGQITVPTSAELGGNFSGPAANDAFASPQVLVGVNNGNPVPVPKLVTGSAWASLLAARLGNPNITAGVTPYYFQATDYNPQTKAPYGINCTTSAQCVFPGAMIATTAFDPVSKNVLALNIFPQNSTGTFSTSAFPLRLRDDKTSGRVDVNTHLGMISTYYYFDDYSRNDPYWPGPLPSSLPGFNVLGTGHTNVADIGDTKTLGSSAVNEFRLAFVRYAPSMNNPSGGTGQSLSALGFASGANKAPGILPLSPIQGVPEMDFKDFFLGISSRIVKLFENTYQVSDNFSKVLGTHTLRFGGAYHYTQMTENLSNVGNGAFEFGGAETGIDFADFLLGAPSPGIQGFAFLQGFAPPSYGLSHSGGAYAQDSWRVRSNLTLNYGLRWEFSTPWAEKHNEIETIVPGLQSVVYPNAPTGWVFPGDPGIPSTLAPTRYNNFAPRAGLAYSPSAEGGFWRKLLGEPGQSSVRVAYGIFYATFEGVTNFNEIGDAPFGNFRSSFTSTPSFDQPWVDRPSGAPNPNPFPVPPLTSSINFAANGFVPISSSPAFFPGNRLPYAEDYELSLQRQLSQATLLTLSYVGTQGHRLLSDVTADPGSPAICNALTAEGAIPIGSSVAVPCGPGNENTGFAIPGGKPVPTGAFTEACPPGTPAGSTCVPGTRTVLNPAFFGPDGYFITAGNSNYNSLQVNLRTTGSRAQVLVGYTFSKSLDDSSGYGEQINPVNARLSRGLSAFDVTNNFVASYNVNLPFDKLNGPQRLTHGWALSGITRFSTGVPVTLIETDDHSLLGTSFTGPQPLPVDTPNFAGGSLGITNPRTSPNHTYSYFNTSLFTSSAIGQEGNANRRFFHGPGINNWDMALVKDTSLTESKKLEFRAEFFNLFNHAQFLTPSGILGSNFGQALAAASPRIGQLSLKLLF